jgi:hypothetical protein
MALDSRGAVITSELNVGLQQRATDASPSIADVHGEAGNPPDASVLVGQHSCERSVAPHTGKRVPRPDSAPADRRLVCIRDQTRRHVGMSDLLLERASVVRRAGGSSYCRSQEQLTPTPAGIFAAATEDGDDVVPSVGCRRMNRNRHRTDHRPPHRPTTERAGRALNATVRSKAAACPCQLGTLPRATAKRHQRGRSNAVVMSRAGAIVLRGGPRERLVSIDPGGVPKGLECRRWIQRRFRERWPRARR